MNVIIISLVVFFVLLVAVIVIYYYLRNKWSDQSASKPYTDINNTPTEHAYTYSGDPKKTKNPYWLDENIRKLQKKFYNGTDMNFDEKQKIADEIDYNNRLIEDYTRETKNMYNPKNRRGY